MSEEMNNGRRGLNMDLGAFDRATKPAKPRIPAEEQRRQIDRVSTFPSRDPDVKADQLNIRLIAEDKVRFQRMAKKERYSYGEFLTILMDAYEGKKG